MTQSKIPPEALEFRKYVGKTISEIRRSKNLTMGEVAIKMNVLPSQIRKIENGEYSINLDMLRKLKEALGFEIIFEV